MRLKLALALAVLSVSRLALAQDYESERSYEARFRNKVFGLTGHVTWLSDTRLWWRETEPSGKRTYKLADLSTNSVGPAFDHQWVAAELSKLSNREVSPDRLPIDALALEPDGAIKLTAAGRSYRIADGKLTLLALETTGVRIWGMTERGRPTRSVRTGPATQLIFANRLGNPVTLWWLDDAGSRQPYGEIPPNGERELGTYAGHAWLLIDKATGREIGTTLAQDNAGTAVILPPPAAPSTQPAPWADLDDATQDPSLDRENPEALVQTSQPTSGPVRRRRPGGNNLAPNGNLRVEVRDGNVSILNSQTSESLLATQDGKPDDGYRPQVFWAPDSSAFVVMRAKAGDRRKIHIIESSPRDQKQPKLITLDYAKPGDKLDIERPVLFKVTPAGITRHDIPAELYDNPYDVSPPRWKGDSSEFTFVYNQRGHQVLRVVGVDAKTATARTVIDETSKTFVCYSHKQFAEYLDATNEIVWMSERSGYNHLYLYDQVTGKVKNAVTSGNWVVRGVDRVDAQARQVYFRASGVFDGQDPYYIHYGRVNLDGTGLTWLTAENANHEITWNPSRTHYIDVYSTVTRPPVVELRNAEGKKLLDLSKGDASELIKAGWMAPEPFVAKARDGVTDIWGVIYRPTHFQAGKKYPVIEMIYAGPQDSFVPKTWSVSREVHRMAELGFILVQIDGMGTSNRSKAFHDVCWKNLGDSGFPDRILWMKAAAAKYPELDITRVGVYGGSAGGQSAARAVMKFGDFYKAAVADCGCHDNQMDKIWWNEQWMGWPVGPEYDASSNVVAAKELTGKLLLLVGELDQNVDPASTMQVVDALIRADKDFEMLVIPGGGHGAGGAPYGRKRRIEFFTRHLLK